MQKHWRDDESWRNWWVQLSVCPWTQRRSCWSSVESFNACLLGPWKHRVHPCFYSCNWVVCISLWVVSWNCLMFCWECLQLKVTDPRKYAFPSQHFIWYLYWKLHCVRLKLTMNFSLDCFQKLFKNSLGNKNCNSNDSIFFPWREFLFSF